MKRIKNNFLFSAWFMMLVLIVLAMVMAFATWVEKDYNAKAASYFIYNTLWFELIYFLAIINILGRIVLKKLYKLRKITVFLFHLAFVCIIIGAGITRYFGTEGMMHIREGEAENQFVLTYQSRLKPDNRKQEIINLPFALKLVDFTIQRYPGSNSPSSYISQVVVVDKDKNIEEPYQIYMNHILKYRGYRFFQSSYDHDEKGTILSVSRDPVGVVVTYSGYFLMMFTLLLSLLNKNSLFRTIQISHFTSGAKKAVITAFIVVITYFSGFASADPLVVPKQKATQLGEILVQDQKGRTEPLYTLSHDILRKVAKKSSYNGLNPMQVFLGLYYDFEHWQNVPLIKLSNSEVNKIIDVKGNYAAFSDFIDLKNNHYKLSHYVYTAYSKPANARNKFDKEIIKLDERINICFMIYNGDFLKIFPTGDSTNVWHTPAEAYKNAETQADSAFFGNIMSNIYSWLIEDNGKNDMGALSWIVQYQREKAQYKLPSKKKIALEVFYYKANVFVRLFPIYALIGFILLAISILKIIKKQAVETIAGKILKWILVAGFFFHTVAFAIRWYLAGHAPMSNGYETMVFISWVTLLSGFVFKNRSEIVLSATAILASLTLMVAHMSFMDPEITNLVPVLKSYWLTLHVSVITSSYAFLGLGAILSLFVLVLYSISTKEDVNQIRETINDLTIINYKTLTIGLYLLTIGTFLGAIWANESWGRYWGWDPKETWSLITIIVYTLVIHSRMMELFRNIFLFNVMSFLAFSSVLMTYFGVNYFLSGLHSYAGGAASEFPKYIYLIIALVVLLLITASRKKHLLFRE